MRDDAVPTAPTPRTPRAEVRERLLAAAAEVFAESGLAGARLDDVAARAGFSKGAVYSNFASKQDLVAEVMQRQTNRVLASLEEVVRIDVPAARLGDVVRAAFGRHDQRAQFALLAEFRGHAVRDPAFTLEFVRQRRELQDGVLRLVDLWFDAHPEVDPGMSRQDLAVLLVAANVGIVFDEPALPSVDPGDVIAAVVEAVTRPR